MTTIRKTPWLAALLFLAEFALSAGGELQAQCASLYGIPGERAPLSLADSSFSYVRLEPAKEIQLYDRITVIVDEKSQVISEGRMNRQQRANIDARLQDWLELDGFGVKPAGQPNGDPRIRALLNLQNQAQANLQARDGMQFRIAATVVDIRPNGDLVLEARKSIRNNHEVWEAALSGIVRREDVLPNNTVLSEDIAELSVFKREEGHVRDGYRRGWLWRTLDRVRPF